eukprot:COSAG01_NODE_37947_length_496_cov_4.100756_1_plen_114_part_00
MTERAASRQHRHGHRDLSVNIVVGPYIYIYQYLRIIATVQSERHPFSARRRDHHSAHATRFSPNPRRSPPLLLRAKIRRVSNPCDQVLSATSAFRSLIGIHILRVDIDVVGTQ